jgi:hypothetical protein
MNKKTSHDEAREELSLPTALDNLIEECRMLLPGIQALFGFQLIAVFNSTFAEKLSTLEQQLHLLAIGLVSVAIALILTPAAYHRQIDRVSITDGLLMSLPAGCSGAWHRWLSASAWTCIWSVV